jgi:hypothetical protein
MAKKPKPVSLSVGDQSTLRPARVPVVLVAGGPDELVLGAREASSVQSPTIAVETCSAVDVATIAARLRPFALVVSEDIYAFDPDEFSALARDVQADLVVIKITPKSAAFLEQALRPSLRAAFRRFRTESESGPVRRD